MTVLLAVLLTGYLTLDGCAFGAGLLLTWLGRDDVERRTVLGTVGPFFLGHEVWLVAAAGLLLGGFPTLDGAVLAGSPLVVVLVGAMVLRDAAFWLRSRHPSARRRRAWDRAMVLASTVLPVGWGAALGELARPDPATPLTVAYPLVCGIAVALATAGHGAVFVALRSRGPVAERAAVAVRRLAPWAVVGLAAAIGGVVVGAAHPAPVLLVAAAALPALPVASLLLHRGRARAALVTSASSVALPLVGIVASRAADLASATAGPATAALLGGVLVVVLPLMAASQAWLWWAFRRPLGTTGRYF